jgi:hypothetical protein
MVSLLHEQLLLLILLILLFLTSAITTDITKARIAGICRMSVSRLLEMREEEHHAPIGAVH